MKNLLLALAISIGIVACGDDSIGSPDVTELDTDRDVSDVDIENPDVVEDTDADVEVTEDVVDTDSEGGDVAPDVETDVDVEPACVQDDDCLLSNEEGNFCTVCSDTDGQIQFETKWSVNESVEFVIAPSIPGSLFSCTNENGNTESDYAECEIDCESNTVCTITGATPVTGYTITFIVAE